ncbi:MAG: OsmC family protein [Marinilabiliaceae bacterium]|nr:OsmC family protein [Marinilabiliaceae bacterium]
MKSVINVKWSGNMAFETDIEGHKLIMDADKASGGEDKGYRPKRLQLASLGGCSGMDVVSVLKKMRVEVDDFEMIIEGDLTEEHPKYFRSIHVDYIFKGKDLSYDKLEKAVILSQDKYCGVSALFKLAIPVTYSIKIIE